MKLKYLLVSAISSVFSLSLTAQNIGDTIVVNVLDYQNSSRDVIANFPTNSSISYEKVIMRYAMRCKNGLVSPPISGQTNIGCGEWDYSCNTYIEEPSQIDSIQSSIDRYVVYPDTNPTGTYSTTPTFYGHPLIQKSVSIQSVAVEDTATVGTGVLQDSIIINSIGNGGKSYVLLTASELNSAGLVSGDINRLGLTNRGVSSRLFNFRIKMKLTSLTNLDVLDTAAIGQMQEVYFHNYTAAVGHNIIPFYTPFNWNGTSNILIEFSNKGNSTNDVLKLECSATTNVEAVSESNDYSLNLFQGTYVEADNYQGVTGTNDRTVEAWIKTTQVNKEIVSWGALTNGAKFSFRLNNVGRLRLEVQSGNIVGTRVINDGQWHHVALTFSGNSTNDVKFYIDGVRDFSSSGTPIAMNTGQSLNVQVSKGFHNRYWDGELDDIRIWSAELPVSTIADWRYRKVDASHPNYSSLELDYTVESKSSTITDNSPNGNHGQFYSANSFIPFIGEEHFKNFKANSVKPNISLYQGTYTSTVANDTIIDTTFYEPYIVTENAIFLNQGTTTSDSIITTVHSYYPVNSIIYNANGTVNSTVASSSQTTITNSVLTYYKRTPSKVEIMSFVTPYGINLDLGINGKAWYFDVTDYLPILEGSKRITLERGGQNQEEMDISFLFIVGTPPRDVVSIQQIWPVGQRAYADISADNFFAPVTFVADTASAKSFKIRSAITGHGQQGEFIPRNHYLNLNGGAIDFNYLVWKECADNPVYPQGGTWIYDRAGWCPGMPTDVNEFDVTSFFSGGNSASIDYGVSTATGDSRYIVNNQMVTYGSPNHTLDGRITEVLSPTNYTAFGRTNPVCNDAEIRIQNTGSTTITSVVVEYWINNGAKSTYTYTGTIPFMDAVDVSLPTPASFWSTLTSGAGNAFHANILTVNGVTDNYSYNNAIEREFSSADVQVSNLFVNFITNSAGSESSYDIRDASGAIIFQRGSMSSNTNYKDTFNLANGCYSFNVYDSDGDGISFFANSDGNGQVALREVGGSVLTFNPDYGNGFTYNFTVANSTVGLEEADFNSSVSLYPNPVSKQLFIETTGLANASWSVYNQQGKLVSSGNLNSNHLSKSSLNVENLSEGIYFIQFEKGVKISSKKFVVTK